MDAKSVQAGSERLPLEQLATRALRTAEGEGASFADVRVDTRQVTRIVGSSRDTLKTREGIEQGAGVRVEYKGAGAFSSTSSLEEDSIRRASIHATRHAKAVHRVRRSARPRDMPPVQAVCDQVVTKCRLSPGTATLDEKLRIVRKILAGVQTSARMKTLVTYSDSSTQRYVASTDGIEIGFKTEEVYVHVSSFYVGGHRVAAAECNIGGTGGIEIVDSESCSQTVAETAQKAKARSEGTNLGAGLYPTVLGPQATGVLFHEVVAHCFEADLVAGRESVINGNQGLRVGPAGLTLVDDPSIDGFWGSMLYDHEGIRARRRVLIDRGVTRDMVFSRQSAAFFGKESNGGALSPGSQFIPAPRAAFSFVDNGKTPREDLIAGIGEGLFIESCRGATTETGSGSFELLVGDAFRVVKGHLGERIHCRSVGGHILEVLEGIEDIGDDLSFFNGFCRKRGQTMGVTYGGPSVRTGVLAVSSP